MMHLTYIYDALLPHRRCMRQIEKIANSNTAWPKLVEAGVKVFIPFNYPGQLHWVAVVLWKEKVSYFFTVYDSLEATREYNIKVVIGCVQLFHAMDLLIPRRAKRAKPKKIWNRRGYNDVVNQPSGTCRCAYHVIARTRDDPEPT